MEFIKKCSVGEKFVGIYYDEENETYVCTVGVQVDESCSDEYAQSLLEEMNNSMEYYDYSSDDYYDVIEVMEERVCELLNRYFENENGVSLLS